jgi:hypothetical protein
LQVGTVLDNVTLLSDQAGLHLRNLTFDLVDFRFDARERQGRFRFGGGDSARLRLNIDGRYALQGDQARVVTRLELGLFGKSLQLELPEVDFAPTIWNGETGVAVTMPILHGRF